MLAEAAIVAEFSDFPHNTSTRYREMAVKATSEAQAATSFVPRWSYKREAQRWENLATEAATSSQPSNPANAKTTSQTLATLPSKPETP